MAAIVSMVSGGAVLETQRFEGVASDKPARINAVNGARYVLAETQGGVAASRVAAKRVGKNLVLEQDSEEARRTTLIIEDFFVSDAQLVGLGAEGEYLQYLAATDEGAVQAAAMGDGAWALLSLASSQPAAVANAFQFSEGASSLSSSALASLAAIAGGVAMSSSRNSGGKAPPAVVASGFALDAQPSAATMGEPAPMAGEKASSADAASVSEVAAPESATQADNDNAEHIAEIAEIDAAVIAEDKAIDQPEAAVDNIPSAVGTGSLVPGASLINVDGDNGAYRGVGSYAVEDIPVIEKVMDDHGAIQGVIENGGYTDDVYPTLMGHADPGVKVHVYRGKFLQGYTVADENGVWSYTPSSAYASGTHSMTVKYEYPNKDTTGYSEPYIITIDKIAPGIPKITGILDDKGRITGAITDQTITDDNRPTITGTAEANAKLIVYDKGKQIGSTTVGADGKWSFTPDTPLADGLHMLSFSAVDRAGNSGEQSEVNEFFVDTRPEKINIYYAEDDVGAIQGEMFNGSVTDDSTPTLFGSATAGGIVKIYEGKVLLGQVIADVDGTWQFTPSVLSDGKHTFHATVTLVATGESGPSAHFVLGVDTVMMAKPSIDQVLDNAGDVQGQVDSGKTTDDNTPTLVGKALAGSTVRVFQGKTLLGSSQADEAGNWRFTVAPALVDGSYKFAAKAESSIGKVSAFSNIYEINIDTTPPPQVITVSSIGKDSGFDAFDSLTNDGGAGRLIQGKLAASLIAGERLELSTDGGRTWKAALVQGNSWFAQDGNPHSSSWTIQTKVIDSSGRASTTGSHAVVLDTIAPKAPTSMVIDGSRVTVTFDKTDVSVGDHISLNNAGARVDYALTAADVTAGNASFDLNVGAPSNLSAAIVDKAGNSSGQAEASMMIHEDFSGGAKRLKFAGSSIDIGKFLLVKQTETYDFTGDTITGNDGTRYAEKWFVSGVTRVWLKGGSATSLEFDFSETRVLTQVGFYDVTGKLVHSSYFGQRDVSTSGHVKFAMPAGLTFTSFSLHVGNNSYGQWGMTTVDNLSVATVVSTGNIEDPLQKDIQLGSAAYHGGVGNNVFSLSDPLYFLGSKAKVSGNAGVDTLKLTGSGQVLDLTTSAGKLSSVEIIDITGSGNNLLKLSLNVVLENGGFDQFVKSGRVQMMVKGNAGDSVQLSALLSNGSDHGDWVKASSVLIGGVTYASYRHSLWGAELLVQQGVTVTLENHVAPAVYGADVEGDRFLHVGVGDAVLAGPGDDTVRITSTDFTLLDGGSGIDVLVLDGQSMHLDLTAMGSRVQGFEKFHLGAGGNQLSLGIDDLLSAGARDMFTANGKLQMAVNGADGEVNLHGNGADWMVGGVTTVDGVNYVVYSATDLSADLFVEQGIQVWGMVLQVDRAEQALSYGVDTLAMADARLEAY